MSTSETPQPEPEDSKLKRIVNKYKTPVACAATAGITFYLTRSTMLQAGKVVFTNLGQQHALDVLQRDILLDFVTERNLVEDFKQYTETLGK